MSKRRQDVQSFIYKYPWMRKQIAVSTLGINPYDWDNTLGQNPSLRKLHDEWAPRKNQPAERMREILENGWRYYFSKECGFNFESPLQEWLKLISLTQPRKNGWGFLTDKDYLLTAYGNSYNNWLAKDFTVLSFVAFHCYPGHTLLDANQIKPWMFAETGHSTLTMAVLIERVRHLYETFFYDPNTAFGTSKDDYFKLQYRTRGFLPEEWLRENGMPPHRWLDLGTTLTAIKEELAQSYGSPSQIAAWNADTYRRDHQDLSYCYICQRTPVDLHHLLPRHRYPQFTWEPTNIVPLCRQTHAAIHESRNFPKEYEEAIATWLGAKDPAVFDNVLRQIHKNAYTVHTAPKEN